MIDEKKIEAEITRLKVAQLETVMQDQVAMVVLNRNIRFVDITAQIERLKWTLLQQVEETTPAKKRRRR
uniref:Uncharacterized protein n=1 Tax=viral metagenome TaxID=1070528 RepID=A0A6M3J4E0_9ZZZZ